MRARSGAAAQRGWRGDLSFSIRRVDLELRWTGGWIPRLGRLAETWYSDADASASAPPKVHGGPLLCHAPKASTMTRTAISSEAAIAQSRASIAQHSRSFALAARLLPAGLRDDACIVYAWCRRADDAVDLEGASPSPSIVQALRTEMDAARRGHTVSDPVVAAFSEVVERRTIPEVYWQELLEGLAMDVGGARYRTLDDLFHYCYRVAGTVGLMMSHVLGVSGSQALLHACHLGMAMQLTNIARDVHEDWQRGRLYLPQLMLQEAGIAELDPLPPRPLPARVRDPLRSVLRSLLEKANQLYESGDRGLRYLDLRSALAVDTARRVYSEIGKEIARTDHDVFAGRAMVSRAKKSALVAGATLARLGEAVRPGRRRFQAATLTRALRFADDVLPAIRSNG